MCEACDHCQHCSRSRTQLLEFWVECRGGVAHCHSAARTDFVPYVPEWAMPLARIPRDAA
jgi:hypothetical protein